MYFYDNIIDLDLKKVDQPLKVQESKVIAETEGTRLPERTSVSEDSSSPGMLLHVYCCLNLYHLKAWLEAVEIPYSRGIKFGSMPLNRQIKIRQIFLCMHVRMVIPYHTAKFKS